MAERNKYVVTLVGSWSNQIEDVNPQQAAIHALKKYEPSLTEAKVELVPDKVTPNVTVMLDKKTGRKIMNTYRIVSRTKKTRAVKETQSVGINSRVDTVDKGVLTAKMTLTEYLKEARKKEREKYAKTVVATYGETDEGKAKWMEEHDAAFKRAFKGGATLAECAKEHFDKKSTDLEETIMSAENFKSDYKVFTAEEIKDKKMVLTALNTGVCMFLVKKSKGGCTAFIGTTSLNIHNAIYEPNIFVLYKMAEVYETYMTINDYKLRFLDSDKEFPKSNNETVKIASCSIRMKAETYKNEPTGRFKVSSLEYSVSLDNIVAMVFFKNMPQVDKTVTAYLAQGIMMAGGNDAEFAKKFAFDREAFNFALTTLNTRKLPYAELVNTLERRATKANYDADTIAKYRQVKDEKMANAIKHIVEQSNTGITDPYMYRKYGIIK